MNGQNESELTKVPNDEAIKDTHDDTAETNSPLGISTNTLLDKRGNLCEYCKLIDNNYIDTTGELNLLTLKKFITKQR